MPMGILDGRSILDGTATINNAQVAYAYFTGEDDSQNAEFVQVQNDDKIHFDCFVTNGYFENWSYHSSHNGYVVFFVKPNDGYLLTGLNADGDGDLYSLDENLGELSDYPGIEQLVSKTKAEDNSSSLVKTSDMVIPGVVIGIVLIAAACVSFAAYKSRRPRGRHTK